GVEDRVVLELGWIVELSAHAVERPVDVGRYLSDNLAIVDARVEPEGRAKASAGIGVREGIRSRTSDRRRSTARNLGPSQTCAAGNGERSDRSANEISSIHYLSTPRLAPRNEARRRGRIIGPAWRSRATADSMA